MQEVFYGKQVIIADREMVESRIEEILDGADKEDVAFMVVGDPFGYIALFHFDLHVTGTSDVLCTAPARSPASASASGQRSSAILAADAFSPLIYALKGAIGQAASLGKSNEYRVMSCGLQGNDSHRS